MKFSRGLAMIAGVVLPIGETIRRWHQLADIRMAPAWLDDWIIGLFLLYGAWRTRRSDRSGRAVLAAAWGFACGMAYASFFMQWQHIGDLDPSGIAGAKVVAIKGVMMVAAVTALVLTLRNDPPALPGN
jgi:hypothetical protein